MRKFKFSNKPFCNDCHFFLFAGVLLLISIPYPIFYIVLILYLVFIFKKTKYLFGILILLVGILASYSYISYRLKPLPEGMVEGRFEVVDYTSGGLILKGEKRILVKDIEGKLKPGDVIEAKVKVSNLEEASYLGDFDAKKFYAAKRITNRGRIDSYTLVNQKWTLSRLKSNILDFYQSHLKEKSFSYVKTLIFGMNSLDSEVKEAYSIFYLSHLLAISGLHIHFIFQFLVFLFQRVLKINGEHLAISIIGLYVAFIGFPISCLRAFLFLFLSILNQRGRIQYTKLDIFSISFLGIVLWNPYQAYQSGFILSFIISFVLLFMEEYTPFHTKRRKAYFQTILCILSILPFLINQTNQIAILGILLSFIIGGVLGKYFLCFVFLVALVPLPYYECAFGVLDNILLYLSRFNPPIHVPSLSIISIVLYYIIFLYFLVCLTRKKKRYSGLYLFFYITILISIRIVNPYYTVTIIDVGQGDSILIELPQNKGNVLVDSYGSNTSYLKSIGIRKLDYVILTHFDQDHIGALGNTMEEFQVDTILYSAYEDVKKIKNATVPRIPIQSGDEIQWKGINIKVLGPIYSYSDSNSNSVVLSFNIKGYTFLLTGDMTAKEEADLIQKYGEALKADVLKVAHHGSNSSSSSDFLNSVSPKYAVISVGKNNAYSLPSVDVCARLEKISKVYMTKDNGNVCFKIGNTLKVEAYRQ